MDKKLKCVFNFGSPEHPIPCSDDVEMLELFTFKPKESQIKAPCCKAHLEYHKMIVVLNKHGFDIEKVMTHDWPNYAKEQYLILKLAGLDDSETKL